VGPGDRVAGRVERGDIRLVEFPRSDKPRPVLVLTRDSAIGYLSRVTVASITSTIRTVPSEVVVGVDEGLKQASPVNLHNVLTVWKAVSDAVWPVWVRRRCARSAARWDSRSAAKGNHALPRRPEIW
jgi:mRNA interferase MazF